MSDKDDLERYLDFLREPASARAVEESRMTPQELASGSWLRFAGRDSDGLAVNTVSGRIFEVCHDDAPPLHLRAPSLTSWLTGYAARVVAGDYRVEEGFGDCYLQLRDREHEARDAASKKADREEKARKSQMAARALVAEAIARDNPDAATAALARAQRERGDALAEAIAELFAGKAQSAFIASGEAADERAHADEGAVACGVRGRGEAREQCGA
jgi:hypothetical protein